VLSGLEKHLITRAHARIGGMEYRGIWLVFFAALLVLGSSAFLRPAFVIRLLHWHWAGGGASTRFVTTFRLLGLLVAITRLLELMVVLVWGKKL
jgi:hypothetical protein